MSGGEVYYCKYGHENEQPVDKLYKCLECRRLSKKKSEEKREAMRQQGRCIRGHDITLPGATEPTLSGARWRCVACDKEAVARASKDKLRRSQIARLLSSQNPRHVSDSEPNENYTGALTERILAVAVKLECALPWERAELAAELAALRARLDAGRGTGD